MSSLLNMETSNLELLGTSQAAKEVGLSKTRIVKHIRVGHLKALKIGKSMVIARSDFENFKVELADRRSRYGWPKLRGLAARQAKKEDA